MGTHRAAQTFRFSVAGSPRVRGREPWRCTACAIPLACAALAWAGSSAPHGIFSLGSAQDALGTPVDERLSNIRTYDFVRGDTLRILWRDIEPSPGLYEFEVCEQAIAVLHPLGLRLSIEVIPSVPAHVLAAANETYVDFDGQMSPVPWDGPTLAAWREVHRRLGEHVFDDGSGFVGPLAEHPALEAVSAAIPGMNGVRDPGGNLVGLASYSRALLVGAVLEAVDGSRDAFPTSYGFVPFFAMDDGEGSTRLDEDLIIALDAAYNVAGQPSLGFFVENLSDAFPTVASQQGMNMAEWAARGGYSMMQALTGWVHPFPASRAPLVASMNPATGIALAHGMFGTRFFELYVGDLDAAAAGALDVSGAPVVDALREWALVLASPPSGCPGDADGNGGVDFADITATLAAWGLSGPAGDADQDGDVDFADVTSVLASFGAACL
jgi:hypothetical protein